MKEKSQLLPREGYGSAVGQFLKGFIQTVGQVDIPKTNPHLVILCQYGSIKPCL